MGHINGISLKNFRIFSEYTSFNFRPINIFTGPNNSGKSSVIKSILFLKDNIIAENFTYDYSFDIEGFTQGKTDYKNQEHNFGDAELVLNNINDPLEFSILWYDRVYYRIRLDKGERLMDSICITLDDELIVLQTEFKCYIDLELFITLLNIYRNYIIENEALVYDDQRYKWNGFYKNLPFDFRIRRNDEEHRIYIERIDKFISQIKGHLLMKNSKKEIKIEFVFNREDSTIVDDSTDGWIPFVSVSNGTFAIQRAFDSINLQVDKELIEDIIKKVSGVYKITDKKRSYFNNIIYLPSIKGEQKRSYKTFEKNTLNDLINELDKQQERGGTTKFIRKWINEFSLGEELIYKYSGNEGINYIRLDNKSLVDLGFGATQTVAIILQIAVLVNRISDNTTILLEEPEANLHPALHSKLAELIVESSREYRIQFIIETHSEYLVRKLQYLTASSEVMLRPEDSIIYYFNRPEDIDEGQPQVKKIEITEDGGLTDTFGKGFYDESTRLTIDLLKINSLN